MTTVVCSSPSCIPRGGGPKPYNWRQSNACHQEEIDDSVAEFYHYRYQWNIFLCNGLHATLVLCKALQKSFLRFMFSFQLSCKLCRGGANNGFELEHKTGMQQYPELHAKVVEVIGKLRRSIK